MTTHKHGVGSPQTTLMATDSQAVAMVVETAESSTVAADEATGVLSSEVKVIAGPIWPPACTLSGGGLGIAHEGEPAYFELVAIDQYGNASESGGEHFELRAHRLLPAGQRKLAKLDYEITDCGDGRYTVTYTPRLPGRWELSMLKLPSPGSAAYKERQEQMGDAWRPSSPDSARSFDSPGDHPDHKTFDPTELIGGRSFMTIVRPKLAEGLSPLEVAAAMEAHARLEVALACEAHAISEGSMWAHDQESPKGGSGAPGDAPRAEGVGDGLHWAIAGEVQEFVVRLPPRPLRSPPRKVVRRTSVGGEDVLTGPLEGLKGGRVGSWSAAEHLVLDQAKLSCYGHVERGFGNEDSRGNDFELLACRDNGDGRFFIKYVCGVAGTLKLSVSSRRWSH